MSFLRAEQRRAARRRDPLVPMVPGIVPDLSDESKAAAMEQAHEALAPLPHSRVELQFLPIDLGLQRCRDVFGDAYADQLAAEVATRGFTGPDASIVLAARMPHAKAGRR